MTIIDLSVLINDKTPAYPGDPHLSIETIGEYKRVGYNDHKVCFGIHSSGTHIDAPFHMVNGGKTLDQMPLEKFIGPGKIIDAKNGFDLEAIKAADTRQGDVVLFNTGYGAKYHSPDYYADDRPAMTEEMANYLVEKKIKMIGLDMCSPDIDPFPVHRILLGAEVLIIENLTNLDKLVGKEFAVYALPIKLQLDGAPARVIAMLK